MKDLSKLERKIGIKFNSQDLFRNSLIHRSYINENPELKLDHNERLEFLGDAVLELVTTEYLYRKYEQPEGELTSWRAALVNARALAKVAINLGLNDYILLSKGEAKDTGRARQYILADALEALIGAIYLDQGIDQVRKFVEKQILKDLARIIKEGAFRDAKSLFQEKAQDKLGITPTYEVLKEWGPDHAKHFRVGVFLNSEKAAEGEGVSKQEAQVEAAKKGLKNKKWE